MNNCTEVTGSGGKIQGSMREITKDPEERWGLREGFPQKCGLS
jgi:hypothetical protein